MDEVQYTTFLCSGSLLLKNWNKEEDILNTEQDLYNYTDSTDIYIYTDVKYINLNFPMEKLLKVGGLTKSKIKKKQLEQVVRGQT